MSSSEQSVSVKGGVYLHPDVHKNSEIHMAPDNFTLQPKLVQPVPGYYYPNIQGPSNMAQGFQPTFTPAYGQPGVMMVPQPGLHLGSGNTAQGFQPTFTPAYDQPGVMMVPQPGQPMMQQLYYPVQNYQPIGQPIIPNPQRNNFQKEKYWGCNTNICCLITLLLFFPAACCVPCCPCDERTVMILPDGRKQIVGIPRKQGSVLHLF